MNTDKSRQTQRRRERKGALSLKARFGFSAFDAVLDSVKAAGLASEVARLKARFVIKDGDMSLRGAA
jgi:hypothetical protein